MNEDKSVILSRKLQKETLLRIKQDLLYEKLEQEQIRKQEEQEKQEEKYLNAEIKKVSEQSLQIYQKDQEKKIKQKLGEEKYKLLIEMRSFRKNMGNFETDEFYIDVKESADLFLKNLINVDEHVEVEYDFKEMKKNTMILRKMGYIKIYLQSPLTQP